MMMIRFLLRPLLACTFFLSSLAGGEPVAAPTSAAKLHATTLIFKNGTYTSIFGLVPKTYTIESEERRQIVQTPESDSAFTLQLLSSETRRILSSADEVPTVETSTKPLTGKTIRSTRTGDGWGFEVIGQAELTANEKREAERLVAAAKPGASPFESPVWNQDGVWSLDLAHVLTNLGYSQLSDITGKAEVRRPSESAASPWPLSVTASFNSGEKKEKVAIEIESKGELTMSSEHNGVKNLKLAGRLVLHGYRDLPDGRNVPYSLITDFDYRKETTPAPPAVPPKESN